MTSRLLQRRIGGILRQLRAEQGLSRARAASVLGTNEAKLKRIENGTVDKIEPGLVEKWAENLGAPVEISTEIARMARMSRGDVTRWDIQVPAWFGTFVALEPTATAIDIYDGETITGLLQVPGYMEATARVSALMPPEEVDDTLAVRANRQPAVFKRPGGPPRMRIIVHEAALKMIEHEDFYEEQLERLRQLDALPNVEIYLLPFSAGLHASASRQYTLMRFDDTPDPEVVYLDNASGAHYESARRVVERWRKVFEATLDDAIRFLRSEYGKRPVA